MIEHPAPFHRGVRNRNHHLGCDRRDGWVGLSACPATIRSEPTIGLANSTRAKWRSTPSRCRSVLEDILDTADIVRNDDFSPVTYALMKHMPASLHIALAASIRLHDTLGRSGISDQLLGGTDRSWRKITAAVWANPMQFIVGTGGAEGAFISAYAGVSRIRRQVTIAAFTIRAEF